ncbi:hypothetical protein ASE82_18265 [Sphingomonas sp. Leaf230]|nr:hypothetical protein ASE82_18265 [Sphingomonas sp. Leaf230]
MHCIAGPFFRPKQWVRPAKLRTSRRQYSAKHLCNVVTVDGEVLEPERTDPVDAGHGTLDLEEFDVGAVAKANDAGRNDALSFVQRDRRGEILG